MATNSVNTNTGAMVALQQLNRTGDALAMTQKRISTGYRVSDAKDDGAAFAVAQSVRADVAGLQSANEQLGGVKGILDTTLAGITKVSEKMSDMKALLVKLSDDTINTDQRSQYGKQYTDLQNEMSSTLRDASYNGRALIDSSGAAFVVSSGAVPANLVAADVVTVRNELATTYTIGMVDGAGLVVDDVPPDAATARAALDDGGNFSTVMNALNDSLNTFGSSSRYVDSQISFNKEKMDSLEGGIGSLVDADLAKESARLQALQIRQQLGTQSLSIANQSPQQLLSLFK
ncbi:flagellin [Humitalea rosea]|uniref:Flagellin n=1 Tax=Humitalea rosea TaxID=990373 RepID=A0A2W7IPI5_9PROT|nr:flagellin [Humitalea rosea]PZW49147.1 flagellin [Humitalea rosea]